MCRASEWQLQFDSQSSVATHFDMRDGTYAAVERLARGNNAKIDTWPRNELTMAWLLLLVVCSCNRSKENVEAVASVEGD